LSSFGLIVSATGIPTIAMDSMRMEEIQLRMIFQAASIRIPSSEEGMCVRHDITTLHDEHQSVSSRLYVNREWITTVMGRHGEVHVSLEMG
jgi:hypothetical protein